MPPCCWMSGLDSQLVMISVVAVDQEASKHGSITWICGLFWIISQVFFWLKGSHESWDFYAITFFQWHLARQLLRPIYHGHSKRWYICADYDRSCISQQNQRFPPLVCQYSIQVRISDRSRIRPGMTKIVPDDADGDGGGDVAPVHPKDWQLGEAAKQGQLDQVKELLQSKANIEARNGDRLQTPLHLAAKHGHRELVELLLEKNAEIEAKDKWRKHTPLHLAAENGHRELVELLLEKNAEIETKAESTPLHVAAVHGHREVVELLLKKNAEIEAKDMRLQTPLHLAARHRHREVVDLLLIKNAEIEAKDKWRKHTPLHLAAENGHREVVELLLKKNAEIEAKDRAQRTPLYIALDWKRGEVATLLIENGADPSAEDSRGRPAFAYAINGSLEAEPLMLQWITDPKHWSISHLVSILQCDNQDSIVKILETWPQDAKIGRKGTELKRARIKERLHTVLSRDPSEGGELGMGSYGISQQNLLWAQEVPVKLKYLPGVRGNNAVHEKLLKILANSPHEGISETDAVQAMVLAAWQQYRGFTWLEIASCFLSVACICGASYGFRHGFALSIPCLYVVAVLHLKKTLDEFVQALPFFIQCFKCSAQQNSYVNFDNVADFLYIVAGWLAIGRQLYVAGSVQLEKPWMAVFAAGAWLRLLYSLRGESWIGPRLLPILSAIKDTVAFFFLMVMCLSAAAHAYYNLQIRNEPVPTYAAVMQVVRLGIFGDFDLFEFEGLDPTYKLKDDVNEWEPIDPSPGPDYLYVHFLFYVTGVGIAVLLMNVLIGVLSSNYERYEDQSVGQFYRARVKMLVELQSRPLGRLFEYQGGRRCRWLFVGLRKLRCIVVTVVFVICTPVVFIVFVLCLPFFQRSGMIYTIRNSLGGFGSSGEIGASDCKIFLVIRDELDANDVRSLRTELKQMQGKLEKKVGAKIDAMQERLDRQQQNFQTLENKLDAGFAQIRELFAGGSQMGRGNVSVEGSQGLDHLRATASSPEVGTEAQAWLGDCHWDGRRLFRVIFTFQLTCLTQGSQGVKEWKYWLPELAKKSSPPKTVCERWIAQIDSQQLGGW